MTKIIDLSLPLENEASEPFPPKITYKGHEDGAKRLGKLAGIDPGEFPEGMGLATDRIELTTHSGTHIDAPWHYGPKTGDERSKTVDEVPLEWCFGPGVRLDFTWKENGTEISVKDLVEALENISYEVQPNDIILIQTGADKYWGTDKYLPSQCGLSAEGTDWLLNKGIRCIGIDAWGLDRPVKDMAQAYKNGQKDALWPSHFHGRKREYLQIEKLANLDLLPVTGFTVSALPVKIKGASAGWCRAVALLEV